MRAPAGKTSVASADARDAAKTTSVKTIRLRRGLSQRELATRSGMHRNSIGKIESGLTREITEDNAIALSTALGVGVEDLGLPIRRTAAEAPSIRLRRLSAEQRQLLGELLSLPVQDFALVRAAIADLRKRLSRKRPKRHRSKGGR
jgi:transcriptional regulator with XRE-family HTH domain